MFKRVLLCLMALAMLISSAGAETKLRVAVNAGWLQEGFLEKMEILELVEKENVFSEIERAFTAKDGEIDIFVFPADQGLYAVKKNGYYAPLNGARRLMRQLSDFYPEVQRALTTQDGDLAAWVLGAGVLGMTRYQTTVLEDNGLTPPTTFGEMLDCCQAILEADALPAGMGLLGEHPYTRESVLDLYMDQYIRASRLEGGMVDFNAPDFIAMVERIGAELPDHDPAFDRGVPEQAVFSYPVGFDVISEDLLAVPQALPGKAGLIDVHLSVAVVNPHSSRKNAAISFLNNAMVGYRIPTYIYDASMDQGARARNSSVPMEDLEVKIAKLRAVEERTADQQEELEELLALYRTGWMISPEDVVAYHALAGGMSVFTGEPVCYDDVLQAAAKRYLSGASDAEGFARECQQHVAMICEENGIPTN